MDNELFELCLAVYDKTSLGFSSRLDWWFQSEYEDTATQDTWYHQSDGESRGDICPLYTSDYLLSKLPKERGDEERTYLTLDIDPFGDWSAYYSDGQGGSSVYIGIHNTPLKALLKLTLALHEAGELK